MKISTKDMSINELKVIAYNLMKQSDLIVENLRRINTEIANREEKERVNAERNKSRQNVSAPVISGPQQAISG